MRPFSLCPAHFNESCNDMPGAKAVMASIVRNSPCIADAAGAAREVLVCIRNIISGIAAAGGGQCSTPHAEEFGPQVAHAIRWRFINSHVTGCDQSTADAVIASGWFKPALAAALAELYMEWAVSQPAIAPAHAASWADAVEDHDLDTCLELISPMLPLSPSPCNIFQGTSRAIAATPMPGQRRSMQ